MNSNFQYNKFFRIDVPTDHKSPGDIDDLISSYFPIIYEEKKIKIEYINYEVYHPIYEEEIYSNQYLSYTITVSINLKITVGTNTYKHSVLIKNIPVMVNDKYFVINGTKKVMIYQLSKTGGIYYDVDGQGRVNNIKLVSLSGSRIELKLSQKDTIGIFVNSSKRIFISDFFSLISNEKLCEYIKYYKCETSLSIFKGLGDKLIKNILFFGQLFQVQLEESTFIISCTKEDLKKYAFTTSSEFNYDEAQQKLYVKAEDLIDTFIFKNKNIHLSVKKGNDVTIKSGNLINLYIRKKLKTTPINVKNSFYLIFFEHHKLIILKSFVYAEDKNNEELKAGADEFDSDNEKESESEDEEEEESSSASPKDEIDEIDIDGDSALSVEYIIDEIIRERMNDLLEIKYSNDELKITEEDIIKLFEYFSIMANKNNMEKMNYDYLTYKRVKRPEVFISHLIIKRINKLKNSTKYFLYEKNKISNINDFLNSQNISNDIRRIFSFHPLVQFLDQTNPLSEISHCNRVSVFNLVNIERYQVSFEGRDINITYFGRICPIQTPEGTNVGLINSITIHANIDQYGFIIAPHYKVNNGVINLKEVVYLKPSDTYNSIICCYHPGSKLPENVEVRHYDDVYNTSSKNVQYMDYSYDCILSMASAMIPGIQHNDARRALMGTNMQKQAVPPVKCEAPIVGTGVEDIVAIKSKTYESCKIDGEKVVYSCALFAVTTKVESLTDPINIYRAQKYIKTNMKTCFNDSIAVTNEQVLNKGDIVLNGYSTDNKRVSLGNNLIVCIMSVDGYGYEDAIHVSSRLNRDNLCESIFISDCDVKAKEIDIDVVEKITLDNPIEVIRSSKHLDSRGIIKIGTRVIPCMILVSKIVPIEQQTSAEDAVLSVIFNREISKFKDISYRATYDIRGIIINIRYFNQKNSEESELYKEIIEKELIIFKKSIIALVRKVAFDLSNKGSKVDLDKIINTIESSEYKAIIKTFNQLIDKNYHKIHDADTIKLINSHFDQFKNIFDKKKKINKHNDFHNIDNNVIEYVKITIAQRRSLKVGDKLAGRHGNKGVVSIVCPMEDMPFMEDGTIVDLVLNPIGIPNRLNIAQILETNVGLTSFELKRKVTYLIKTNNPEKAKTIIKKYLKYNIHHDKQLTPEKAIDVMVKDDKHIQVLCPSFNSISFAEIKNILKDIEAPETGTYVMRCGKTGEEFNRKIHVGIKYIMKLTHMAIDKASARETGPCSTISKQPVAGRSKYGGQRVGEMEKIVFEAYGASYVSNETLFAKSDDEHAKHTLYEGVYHRSYSYISSCAEAIHILCRNLESARIKINFFKYQD